MPFIFKEHYISEKELGALREEKVWDSAQSSRDRPPLLPVIVLTFSFFSCLFNYVLLETLTSTLAMDQWAWSPQHAVERMGFITMGAGALGVLVFSMIGRLSEMITPTLTLSPGPLSRRVDERWLLVVLGAGPMLVGRIVMLPIPGLDHPPVNCLSNTSWVADFQECHTDIGPGSHDNNLVRNSQQLTSDS